MTRDASAQRERPCWSVRLRRTCAARRRRARRPLRGCPPLACLLLALAAGAALASAPPLPSGPLTYGCLHTTTRITIDGNLDEPAWRRAEMYWDFRLPDGVTRPSVSTEFRALWDDRNLYLAFVCKDPDIIATMTKRDSGLYDEDCVEVFLSTGKELRRYYEFELSPRNVQMDASVFPTEDGKDKVVDYSWNCAGLRTATSTSPEGWVIEVAIPFDQIGRDKRAPQLGETWRANFYRADYTHGRPTEYICWSPMMEKEANFHCPDRFGRFMFAEGPASGPVR